MTTTQAAKTTIYYTPYQGNLCPIYDGTNFSMSAFSELSVLTTDTTKSPAAIGASKVNDWFVWNDAGTVRVGHGPDWTNDTTRSAGTALVMVNGILLNAVALTNGPAIQRGTYVGTTRSNASSQLDWIYGGIAAGGTAGFFGLWNVYNRVSISSRTGDSSASWTYNSTTWRAANVSNNVRTTFVRGLDEDSVIANYQTMATGGASGDALIGIGLDSTSSAVTTGFISLGTFASGVSCAYQAIPGLGVHFLQAVERQFSTASVATYFGVRGADQVDFLQVMFNA